MGRLNRKKNRIKKYTLFLAVFALLFVCSEPCFSSGSPKGIYHLVKKGETIAKISNFYNVKMQALMKANEIKDPDLLKEGRVLFIPGVPRFPEKEGTIHNLPKFNAKKTDESKQKHKSRFPDGKHDLKVHDRAENSSMNLSEGDIGELQKNPDAQPTSITSLGKEGEHISPTMSESAAVSGTTSDKAKSSTSVDQASNIAKVNRGKKIKAGPIKFRWPVRGKVTRRFGVQPNGMYCNGITITSKEKTPVLAAAEGKVIFSSSLKDYGETIIVKHGSEYATVYTNLGIRTVAVNDQIKMGDQLGILGKATEKGKPYLGFEVRYRNKAVDPLSFLP